MLKKTVLVVEDEISIRKVIVNYFQNNNYNVLEASNGKDAIDVFEDNYVDLIILDVMLPMLDGWTVLKKIRKTSSVLVIMLTALEDEDDKLNGFHLGADEYVTKPFSPKVLVARANALFARTSGAVSCTKQNSILEFDDRNHSVNIKGEMLELTPKEYIILNYLAENRGNALSREQILNHVWGYDFYGDIRVVDNHIKNLRNKLGCYGTIIKTITGLGYRIEIDNV